MAGNYFPLFKRQGISSLLFPGVKNNDNDDGGGFECHSITTLQDQNEYFFVVKTLCIIFQFQRPSWALVWVCTMDILDLRFE